MNAPRPWSSALGTGLALALAVWPAGATAHHGVDTVPGMPPVPDAKNLYSETRAGMLSPAAAGALPRVYVPHLK